MTPKPFLRWSGGKRRALQRIYGLCPSQYNDYFEPFVGAACLYFQLRPSRAMLSDTNSELVRTYLAVRDSPKMVADLLQSIPPTKEAFIELRRIDPNSLTSSESAARFIFLMKSCFNGVYRENKKGHFNTPWGSRVYRLPTTDDLLAVSSQLKAASLAAQDFEFALASARAGDFVYLDPPYPQKRYRGEFGSEFTEFDLKRLVQLCNCLTSRGVKVMLSYVHHPALDGLRGWLKYDLVATRSVSANASSRGSAREVVVLNY